MDTLQCHLFPIVLGFVDRRALCCISCVNLTFHAVAAELLTEQFENRFSGETWRCLPAAIRNVVSIREWAMTPITALPREILRESRDT